MARRLLCGLVLSTLAFLPGCATTNGVRWAYGMDSVYDEPDSLSESLALRALVGVPVIVGGAAWDLTTWPLQIIFGVWPTWGRTSTMMNPTAG
ncbi:MAG: hypothetical protein JNK78_07150 [Planctomycetes bacterium]|nr:hypothetical protein [Planctomycetota bacterium]